MNRRSRLADRLAAPQMSFHDALDVFGISPDFTPEQLKAKYRQLSLENHPDRGGDTESMSRINNAYEVLSNKPSMSFDRQEPPRRPQQQAWELKPNKNYTTEDKNTWKANILRSSYLRLKTHEILTSVPMDVVFGGLYRPLGSVVKTKRMKPEEMETYLDKILANTNVTLLDLGYNERGKQAWITVKTNTIPVLYQSFEFAAIPPKKVKVNAVSRDRMLEMFRENGLALVAGGDRNSYFGEAAKWTGRLQPGMTLKALKLQPKVLVYILRTKYESEGGQQQPTMEVKVRSYPYGQLTEEILTKLIQAVKAG